MLFLLFGGLSGGCAAKVAQAVQNSALCYGLPCNSEVSRHNTRHLLFIFFKSLLYCIAYNLILPFSSIIVR